MIRGTQGRQSKLFDHVILVFSLSVVFDSIKVCVTAKAWATWSAVAVKSIEETVAAGCSTAIVRD
jgi:hypothetical protein